MAEIPDERREAAEAYAGKLNALPHGLFGAWLGILILFWLRAYGMRSADAPPFEASVTPLLALAIAMGFAVALLPRGWYVPRSLCVEHRLYRLLGADRLRAIITDGDRINRKVRARFPGYRVHVGADALEAAARRSFTSERAHHGFWWFGVGSSIAGWIGGWPAWAIGLLVGNVLVNLLPMLLQRATRARIVLLRPAAVHAAFERSA
ncbi:hypothetical protein WJS89_03455 [Sphingomicrobium sp. XHP0235]|uniref:glycosyl-4,4'-diaponeurosporenoate acyltransferase CrtO family protein n=1 Tax=Sphingomicrobium aquimarinum TaxID=3133971 RepID=UPI0031FE60CA